LYDPKYLIPLDTHNPGNFDESNKVKPEAVAKAFKRWQMTRGPKANIVGKDSIDNQHSHLMQVSLQMQDTLNGLVADHVALKDKHDDLNDSLQVVSSLLLTIWFTAYFPHSNRPFLERNTSLKEP